MIVGTFGAPDSGEPVGVLQTLSGRMAKRWPFRRVCSLLVLWPVVVASPPVFGQSNNPDPISQLIGGLFKAVTGEDKAKLNSNVPAEIDLARFRRLAVTEFGGRGGREVSSALESELTRAGIGALPYFAVVARDSRFDAARREQDMVAPSARFDSKSTVQLGKLLGADALVSGSVLEYDSNDRQYSEDWEDRSNGRKFRKRCVERVATVRFDLKFTDAKTGQVAASVPGGASVKSHGCAESGSQPGVSSPEQLLAAAVQGASQLVVAKVVPHTVMREVELRTRDDSSNRRKSGDTRLVADGIRLGVRYAREGAWDMAMDAWGKAEQLAPDSPSLSYNLGVAYEAKGQLMKARDKYQAAAKLKNDEIYIKAALAIESALKNADILQRQLDGR